MDSIIIFVFAVIRFIVVIYYLCSITFRLAFQYIVPFSRKHWLAILCDYIADGFFWAEFGIILYKYLKAVFGYNIDLSRSILYSKKDVAVAPDPSEGPGLVVDYSVNALQELMHEVDSAGRGKIQHQGSFSADWSSDGKPRSPGTCRRAGKALRNIVCLFPYEIIGYLCGYSSYYMFRIPRLGKVFDVRVYWSEIMAQLEAHDILTGPSSQRVLGITTFMAVLAHLAACAFYALALCLMQHSVTLDTWLSHDGIVIVEEGQLVFTRTLAYRYVRALYWSVVTEVSTMCVLCVYSHMIMCAIIHVYVPLR